MLRHYEAVNELFTEQRFEWGVFMVLVKCMEIHCFA